MELNLIICGSENIISEFVIHGYRTQLKSSAQFLGYFWLFHEIFYDFRLKHMLTDIQQKSLINMIIHMK